MQGMFPVRQPRNGIRESNADTDKAVAAHKKTQRELEMELEIAERKHLGELEYLDLEITEKVSKKGQEVKALTTGITPDDNALGPLILSARKLAYLSQKELAVKSGVKIETISAIENSMNGYALNFTMMDIQLLASALNLDFHPPRLTAMKLANRS